MTSDLNDKYQRLMAAGMPEVEEGFQLCAAGWYYKKSGFNRSTILTDQHAEDLVTAKAIRHFNVGDVEHYVDEDGLIRPGGIIGTTRGQLGRGPTIIDAILDAVEE